MSDTRSKWGEAAGRLGQLGGKVKRHYDQQHRHEDEESTPAAAATGNRVNDTAAKLAATAKDVVGALGAAAKDPQVKGDVRDVGRSLAGAVEATSTQISDQAQRAWHRYTEGGRTKESDPAPAPAAGNEPPASPPAAGNEPPASG